MRRARFERRCRVASIRTAFADYYPADLLERIHCSISGQGDWLTRLLRAPKGANHPLHHLLMMRFLDEWESKRLANPNMGRKALRKMAPAAFSYLRRHDREWRR